MQIYQQMLQIICDIQSSSTICRGNKLYDRKSRSTYIKKLATYDNNHINFYQTQLMSHEHF